MAVIVLYKVKYTQQYGRTYAHVLYMPEKYTYLQYKINKTEELHLYIQQT